MRNSQFGTIKIRNSFILGRDIEKIAKDQFLPSFEITERYNEDKVAKTYKMLEKDTNILEASFESDGVIVQVDILKKNDDGTYSAIEIKSGSSLKDDYIDDVTIQYWTIVNSKKIILKSIEVWYVNKQASGEADIFEKVELTEKAVQGEELFKEWLKDATDTYNLTEEPSVGIGTHCYTPNGCPFQKYCWKNIDDPKSVLNLPSFSQRFKAYNSGIDSIDHPEFAVKYADYISKNPIIIEALRKNDLVVDYAKMKEMLSQWIQPLSFFDFETLNVPIPIIEGTKPYEQTVVQYSLHVLNNENLDHKEFLHQKFTNPFEDLVPKMISDLEGVGSIVSYNQKFEITRINELSKKSIVESEKESLAKMVTKFVDLMDVVKACIYHPSFMGSYSLKVVSPTLLGYENGGYTDSEIKSGSDVAEYYEKMLFEPDLEKKEKMKESLLKYCKYDTLNLYLIYEWMLKKIGPQANGE